MKLSGVDHRVAEGHESRREAPSGGEVWEGGVPLTRMGVRGCHPGKILILRRNLAQFGTKLTFLQFSTFLNESIAI